MFHRETATENKDLPHNYFPTAKGVCELCDGEVRDERHVLWTTEDMRERSHDQNVIPRETGS